MTVPTYREEQRLGQWWLWLLVGSLVAMQWWGFCQQIVLGRPWGDRPAPDWMMVLIWLCFGIGLPIFFLYMRLIVTVSDDAIEIHYRPLTRRTILMAEITHAEPRTYSPLREFGGWGIRGLGGRRAYNVRGNHGVEVMLVDGSRVLIGSQRADELARAIAAARGDWR